MKVSHTEPFNYQSSITITGVGDPQFTNTNGYVCHLIHSGHSHYHHWCWWSSIHQHQRLCMPPRLCTGPLEELSNEYTNLNSSEQPHLHQLPVPSEGFLNYQSSIQHSSDLSSISHVNHVIFSIPTQLWSRLNCQCKPCPILNSTQQHSFCILIRSDLSSMHSVSLDSTQLNIPVSCN